MSIAERADIVRRFNRFYTRELGVLEERWLHSEFSLTETRVLYEIAEHSSIAAAEIARELNLDAGYLSRIIASLQSRGLLVKKRSKADGRAVDLSLTTKGKKTLAPLNAASQNQMVAMLEQLSHAEQQQLVDAMRLIHSLLAQKSASYILRDPEPGDIGLIMHRQAKLYALEYGWNGEFEGFAAEIVGAFVRSYDRKTERCWIAERDGLVSGSVFLTRDSETTAKLRLLYVEPSARGLGIGRRLVDECIRFAKSANYNQIILWTNSVLSSARRIYETVGFNLVEEKPHHSFGKELVGQTWRLEL